MTDLVCAHCSAPFQQKPGLRPMRFCSRKCGADFHKARQQPAEPATEASCAVCQTPFLKTKRHARYCSKTCYKKAYHFLNPEKNRARAKARRKAKPEWYRERYPKYYRGHRAKLYSTKPWTYLLKSRQCDARARGLPFELTKEWAAARWTGKCEITGIEFRVNGKKGPHPFSPSLDKIDADKGYTQSNSRFILWGCNAIKGVGTDEDMYEIAAAITRSRPSSGHMGSSLG